LTDRARRLGRGGVSGLANEPHAPFLVLLRHHVVRLPSVFIIQVDQRNPNSGEDSRRSRRASEEHRGRVPRPDPEADRGVDSSG